VLTGKMASDAKTTERKILRKIYGPKYMSRECGEWESMQNYSMYISHQTL
jgi:hypothetical protein